MGRPSIKDFLGILDHQMIPNIHVTKKDVQAAEIIFGPDLGTVQGKTPRQQPLKLRNDYISIPRPVIDYYKNIVLEADILYADTNIFLMTISDPIQFITGTNIKDCKPSTITAVLLKVFALYRRRGFIITVCTVNNEFQSIKDIMDGRKHGVPINVGSHGEHMNHIERYNRTAKERTRAVITVLPYRRVPREIVIYAILFSILWLNFVPPITGVSQRVSPSGIVTGK